MKLTLKEAEELFKRLTKAEAEIKRLGLRVSTLESMLEPGASTGFLGVKCPTCKAKPHDSCVTTFGKDKGAELRYVHASRGDVQFRRAH